MERASRRGGADPSAVSFLAFLRQARPGWTHEDAEAARRKLVRLGIACVLDLREALSDEHRPLNERLRQIGLKTFREETLAALRESAYRTASASPQGAPRGCSGSANRPHLRLVRFELLSESPRVYGARGFLTEEECGAMCRLAVAFGYGPSNWGVESAPFEIATGQDLAEDGMVAFDDLELLRNLASWRAALTGAPECCLTPQVRKTLPPAAADGEGVGGVFIPMHLDAYVDDSYMTMLVYLSTLPPDDGGQTLFPLARKLRAPHAAPDDRQLDLSSRLIAAGRFAPTRRGEQPPREAALHDEAARLATAAAAGRPLGGSGGAGGHAPGASACDVFWGEGGRGLAVAARRGDALCFFTRRPDGSIDPASWHGVATMRPGAGARCLSQLFHRLPPMPVGRDLRLRDPALDAGARAEFCRAHMGSFLRPCEVSGVRFEVDGAGGAVEPS